MTRSMCGFLQITTIVVGLWLCSVTDGLAQTLYTVNVNTSGLSGTSGGIVFDFIGGDTLTPNNTVTISSFASDATLLGANNDNSGDATGDLPGSVILHDAGLSESFRGAIMGNTLSFTLSVTDNYAPPGVDEFAFFLTDPTNTGSIVSTSDPTGSDALFALNFDGSPGGQLIQFSILTPGVSYTLTPTVSSVPEPSPSFVAASAITFLSLAVWRNRRRAMMA